MQRNATTPRNATHALVQRNTTADYATQCSRTRKARQGKARQGKARQGKARQGKARQGKARQGKARQGKARQGKARQGKARQGKARQGKARQGKARQGKARQGKARQGKARQGKARQGKARQGKARQGNLTAHCNVTQHNIVLDNTARHKLSTVYKNRSAKRTCGFRIMPLFASRTRAHIPFGTSFASHAHMHAYESVYAIYVYCHKVLSSFSP